MTSYPRIERAPYNVEVPRPRNGRPAYAWVAGWRVVRFPGDDSGIGQPLARARHELRQFHQLETPGPRRAKTLTEN